MPKTVGMIIGLLIELYLTWAIIFWVWWPFDGNFFTYIGELTVAERMILLVLFTLRGISLRIHKLKRW